MSTRASTAAGRRRAAARTGRGGGDEHRPKASSAPPKAAKTKKAKRAKTRTARTARAAPAQRTTRRVDRPRAPKRGRVRASARRRIPLPHPWRWSLRGGSFRRRATIVGLVAAALAIGYFAWLRDSSLVAVKTVTVTGLGGGGSDPAAAALTSAAHGMTTLDVDETRLDAVAARFPEIASISADPHFPNGMTINVVERPPVMLARDGGRETPVAADGTLLVGDAVPDRAKLPTLAVDQLPAAGRLAGDPLREALVLGAAPPPLRAQISDVSYGGAHGVTVTLKGGIDVRFGSASGAAQKWAAAAAVLADPRLTTLAYVDVRVPRRPAVGGAG